MSLVDQSMVPFQTAYVMIVGKAEDSALKSRSRVQADASITFSALILLILAGNTAFVSRQWHLEMKQDDS